MRHHTTAIVTPTAYGFRCTCNTERLIAREEGHRLTPDQLRGVATSHQINEARPRPSLDSTIEARRAATLTR